MPVIAKEHRLGYNDDPTHHFGFEKYIASEDFLLVPGWSNWDAVARYKGPRVLLELEEPNRWLASDPMFRRTDPRWRNLFDLTMTLCPYSRDFLSPERRALETFFPVNWDHVPGHTSTDFDVIYVGNNLHRKMYRIVKEISHFNSIVVSSNGWRGIRSVSVNHRTKLELLSRSRIAIVHNQLFLRRRHVRQLIKSLPNWRQHGAFSHLPTAFQDTRSHPLRVPQLKSRIFEAAACGALPLVINDDWNVHERYFLQMENFVSTSIHSLSHTIAEILKEFPSYTEMLQRNRELVRDNFSVEVLSRTIVNAL